MLFLSACQPLVAPDNGAPSASQTASPDLPANGALAEINGIAAYYEIHGEGEPLLFMPGDMRTTEDAAELTDLLASQ